MSEFYKTSIIPKSIPVLEPEDWGKPKMVDFNGVKQMCMLYEDGFYLHRFWENNTKGAFYCKKEDATIIRGCSSFDF